MLSKNKIKAIGILRNSVFAGNNENYYAMLSGYNVKSCKDLTERQASSLIAKLHELEGTSRKTKYSGKGKRGSQTRITKLQAERIELLMSLLGWNDKSIYKFINKQLKKNSGVEMLRNYEARKVIIGITKVLADKHNYSYSFFNDMSNRELRGLKEKWEF